MTAAVTPPYATSAEILANAQISDSPEIMRLCQVDAETQLQILEAQLQGYHIVCVSWSTGHVALMFCEPGCQWPEPETVVAAYQDCLETSEVFSEGTHHD